ncbi:hypothetical protein HT031_004286 [Scenedesmus sp. PABB004]|nr:hypothetical protein HT031_004286 [Scenedesmus sp. PABB004]
MAPAAAPTFDSALVAPPALIYAAGAPPNVCLQELPFSPIDRHVGINRCSLPWAWLFATPLAPAALATALADALAAHPALAGRVRPTGPHDWALACCNAGVPLALHASRSSLADVVRSGVMRCRRGFPFPDASSGAASLPRFVEPLDAAAVLAGTAPLLAARLTQLAGGGCILAVTASHVAVDGRSLTVFMAAWGAAHAARAAGTAPRAPRAAPLCGARLLRDLAARPPQPPPPALDGPGGPGDATATAAVARAAAPKAAVAAAAPPADLPYSPHPLHATRVLAPGWLRALRRAWAAGLQLRAEARCAQQAWAAPARARGVSTELLHIPDAALRGLKVGGQLPARARAQGARRRTPAVSARAHTGRRRQATASALCGEGQWVSTNDALTALVWVLCCALRGRPLPGQPRPPGRLRESCVGIALDLRTAAAPTPASVPGGGEGGEGGLPLSWFGSAAWSVHVRACAADGAASELPGGCLAAPWRPDTPPEAWAALCGDGEALARSLAAGAARVRGALSAVRREPGLAGALLRQVEDSIAAPPSAQLAMAASLVHRSSARGR